MEPNERIDIDRFDAWLDQLGRGIAGPVPDDAADLAHTAMWLHEKGQQIMSSAQFERRLRTQLRPALANGSDPAITTLFPRAWTATGDATGLPLRALMAAAVALLIAIPAILLLVRSFNSGPDNSTIPAPMNSLAQSGTPVACTVEQPTTLTISGTPENPSLLQQTRFVSDPGHPGNGAAAVLEQDLPTGPAASEGDLADIQHVLSTLGACIHAGDFAGADALYSDDSFRRAGVSREISDQATPTVLQLPAEIVTPVILSSNVLPDGRIGVLIEQDLWGYGFREYYIFVDSSRGWLVDEVSLVAPAGMVGSPVASTDITVIATDLAFTPRTLLIPANTEVTVAIENEGIVPHSFAIPEAGIDVRVAPGQSEVTTLNLPAGTYEFKSTVANQGGFMQGTLIAQ